MSAGLTGRNEDGLRHRRLVSRQPHRPASGRSADQATKRGVLALRTAPRHAPVRIAADIGHVVDEGAGRGFPGMLGGEFEAGLRRNVQRGQAGRAQIVVQRADRRVADDVARAGDRKGRDRQAAGQRLQQHQAERIGLARKHEDVGAGIGLAPAPRPAARRETPPADISAPAPRAPGRRRRSPWCRADRDRETPRDSFPPRPGRRTGIPGAADRDRRCARMKQPGVDAARPQHDVAKAARAQFARQRRRRRHHRLARRMEPAQRRPDPGFRNRQRAPRCIRESGYGSWW